MSAGADRQRAARERLSARGEGKAARDADLVSEALARVRDAVEQSDPVDEEAANKIASDEIKQMREEKRERHPIFTR